MKFLKSLFFLILASSFMLGQNTSNTSSASDNIADELKKLREAIAEQQKQIAQQQQQIQKLEQQLSSKPDVTAKTGDVSPRIVDASLRTSGTVSTSASAQPVSDAPPPPQEQPKASPLSFRIGGAEFTPGGFVDFENIFRSTNTGNISATAFGGIPFSNTVQGHLTEFKSTGQYSRFNLKTTAKYGKNDVTGYIEFDFNGNDPGNVFVTSNSHVNRLRLYWLDLKRGKWEFLGGQTWGLQTPNRVGVSPNPADLSLGYGEDAGIGVGYNYTRAAEFRAAYHFNDHWVWAVAAQNPDQFSNGEVTFPFGFNAQLGSGAAGGNPQLDSGGAGVTPNLAPDVLTKIAFDHDFAGGHRFHFEAGGVETTTKVTVLPSVTGGTFKGHTNTGGGAFGDLLVDLFKGSEGRVIRFVGSGMWGYGVGRYLNGLAPQAVIVPTNAAGTTCIITGTTTKSSSGCDVRVSGVHSADAVGGFEFLPHPKAQFGAYYGVLYAQRNFFTDITSTATTQPFIGFGGPNSGTNNNRTVQEGTVDWNQTFWRNPQYGAVLLIVQASYLTRSPWFVAAGAPKNAHLGMSFVSLRYVLP